MSGFEDLKNLAAAVRKIEPADVLNSLAAARDKYDKNKWRTDQGVISVTGQKFMNWSQGVGGGGAIDLAMHLMQYDFKSAVFWLAERFSVPSRPASAPMRPTSRLAIPPENKSNLPRVVDYLRRERRLPSTLIDNLIQSGKLYADARANVVFLLLGKEKRIVGAELRGTNVRIRWRGMAKGSRKDLGFFYVGTAKTKKVALCESAIDAASFLVYRPDFLAISTSGVHPNPAWLKNFIDAEFEVFCAFDDDEAGDNAGRRMIARYPGIKRLRPPKHDWNDSICLL